MSDGPGVHKVAAPDSELVAAMADEIADAWSEGIEWMVRAGCRNFDEVAEGYGILAEVLAIGEEMS